MTSKDPCQFLLTSIQKSYFTLSRPERAVLDTALQKYRPGRSDLIPVRGIAQLKPALRLMTDYRLVIQEVTDAEVFTNYTRWLECVQVKEGPEQEVYVTFSPRFERIWLEQSVCTKKSRFSSNGGERRKKDTQRMISGTFYAELVNDFPFWKP